MASRMLRMFIICFIIATLLNVVNYVIYLLYDNRNLIIIQINKEARIDLNNASQETTKNWDILNSRLVCGENSTNCTHDQSFQNNNESDPSDTGNSFYYYVNDATLSDKNYFCPRVPSGLGPVKADKSIMQLNAVEEIFSELRLGGLYKPTQCIPRRSVAIIVPMQVVNRTLKNYIGTFLYYIHPFLMKQLSEYQVFVIVQVNYMEPYARGKLFNTGFIEAQNARRGGWDCVIFHDAHLVPTDTRNLYRCSIRPRQLISRPKTLRKFGGAVAISPSLFKKINGFSNLNWGNDGDYINMFMRLKDGNNTIETNVPPIGKYATLQVIPDLSLSRPEISHATTPIYLIDGLSSLSYRIVNLEFRHLYTLIEVDFNTTD